MRRTGFKMSQGGGGGLFSYLASRGTIEIFDCLNQVDDPELLPGKLKKINLTQTTVDDQPAVVDDGRDGDGANDNMREAPALSIAAGSVQMVTVNGSAAFRSPTVDVSGYAGASTPYILVATDTAGKKAWGYPRAADTVKAFGVEQITGDNSDVDTAGNWAASGTATLTGGYNSGDAGHETTLRIESGDGLNESAFLDKSFFTDGITEGAVYNLQFDYKWISKTNNASVDLSSANVFSDEMSEAAGTWATFNGDVTGRSTSAGLFVYVSRAGGAATDELLIDNISLRKVTNLGTDAVTIVSAKGGSTQNWAGVDAGFNPNDSLMTVEIRRSDFQALSTFSTESVVDPDDPTNFVIIDKMSGNYGFRVGIDASDQVYCSIGDGTDIQTATGGTVSSAVVVHAGYDGANAYVALNGGARTTQAQDPPADLSQFLRIMTDGTNYANGIWRFTSIADEDPGEDVDAIISDILSKRFGI